MFIKFKQPKKKFLYSFFISLILLNIIGFTLKDRYFLNYSGSIPRGIYKIKDNNIIEKNDVVIFKTFNYSAITNFTGSTKFEFIKFVAGIPGDQIEIKNNKLYINKIYKGNIYKYTEAGKKLPELKIKKIQIPKDHFFLMGTAKNSFDSRYYGLVNKNDITFIVRPFLTF